MMVPRSTFWYECQRTTLIVMVKTLDSREARPPRPMAWELGSRSTIRLNTELIRSSNETAFFLNRAHVLPVIILLYLK